MDMDPQYSFQDVIRCDLCETHVPVKYCDICHIHLCAACVWVHLSNKDSEHYIVPFNLQKTTPTCQKHSKEVCQEFCESCCIPVCTICVASGEHDQHTRKHILIFFETKKELIQNNLQERSILHPERKFIDEPLVKTHYGGLNSASCLNDSGIWTCCIYDKTMRLYTLKGTLLMSIQTKSGNTPWDIAVIPNGDLVYTDHMKRSIYIMNTKERYISTKIKLRKWKPLGVCCTSSNDLLVTMSSDDYKETKVVRYSNLKEIQSIQWDDQGKPLYSSGHTIKYLSENKNLDICVADTIAGAIVVVNKDGKLRFRYTGPTSTAVEKFEPRDITTDSTARILTTDRTNWRIHMVNPEGLFLRFINSYGIIRPCILCVNSMDKLFVAEQGTGKFKKIHY